MSSPQPISIPSTFCCKEDSETRTGLSKPAQDKDPGGVVAPSQADGYLEPDRIFHPIPPHLIDPDVVKVIRRLHRFRHLAYLVGGCVRDLLLGVTPKDFDVATSASPTEVRKIFHNCKLVGRRFRLAHILFGGQVIEVSTFRRCPQHEEENDGDYLITEDNCFGTPWQDAFRRDFTINGLFYDLHSREIVDYVGGMKDIKEKVVRCIGEPEVRLQEDPIRVLRAIRFSARLGLNIEPVLLDSINRLSGEIKKSAAPRVLEEIYRFMRPGCCQASLEMMRSNGVLSVLLPELHSWLAESAVNGRSFSLFMSKLDESIRSGQWAYSNAALLAALLYLPVRERILGFPVVHDLSTPCAGDGAGDHHQGLAQCKAGGETTKTEPQRESLPYAEVMSSIAELVAWVAQRLRVPRRDQEQIRLLLFAQHKLEMTVEGIKGGRPGSLVRRSFFDEAFLLFELCRTVHVPTDQTLEGLARLRRMREQVLAANNGERSPQPSGERKQGDGRNRRPGRGRGGSGSNGPRRRTTRSKSNERTPSTQP